MMDNTIDIDRQIFILEKSEIECADVSELMAEYVDNELLASLRARIDTHKRNCSQCQELEEGYRLTIQLASEIKAEPLPSDVSRRLRQNLNRRLKISLPV